MSKNSYSMTENSITVVCDGVVHTVVKTAVNFKALRTAVLAIAALESEDVTPAHWAAVAASVTVAKAVFNWAQGRFNIRGADHIQFDGVDLPQGINQRLLRMVEKEESPLPLLRFWERLQKNPSYRSVNQLWGFLEHENIPLDEDGFILAYKSVRPDYRDIHSGTFVNTPGTTLEMPRNQISDDPNFACHEGFHVGALGYVRDFGTGERRILIVRVDPEDVVCVPFDAQQQKMRVCKYYVVGHYGSKMPSTVMPAEDLGTRMSSPPDAPEPGAPMVRVYISDTAYDRLDEEDQERIDDEIGLSYTLVLLEGKEYRCYRTADGAAANDVLLEIHDLLGSEWDVLEEDEDLLPDDTDDDDDAFDGPESYVESMRLTALRNLPDTLATKASKDTSVDKKTLNRLEQEHAEMADVLDSLNGKKPPRLPKEAGSVGLAPQKAQAPKPTPKPVPATEGVYDFASMDTMSIDSLAAQSIDAVRKYASNHLKIVGASKIPGGKPALLLRIEDVRRK